MYNAIMTNLDSLEEIKQLDPKNVYGSTGMFLDQCRQIREIVGSYDFKTDYSQVKNLVISGMGGSAYGGYVVSSLLKLGLKVPVISNNDYTLPSFVGPETLVFVTSYSGSTEETLASLEVAKEKGCKVIGLSAGGKLAENVRSYGFEMVTFDPVHNPSGQPRLGTGYIVLGTIEILRKLGLIILGENELADSIDEIESVKESVQNEAKGIAQKVMGHIPLIIGAEHLAGNVYIMRNQFNETSKSFSSFHILPELNHHLLEGLKNPTDRKLIGLFVESAHYSERVAKRLSLSLNVFEKNNTPTIVYRPKSKTKLSESMELLVLGGYITFYLAILYDQDPSLIPWVDWFKEQLSQ